MAHTSAAYTRKNSAIARKWMENDKLIKGHLEHRQKIDQQLERLQAEQSRLVDSILSHTDAVTLQMGPTVVFECSKVTHTARVIRTTPAE